MIIECELITKILKLLYTVHVYKKDIDLNYSCTNEWNDIAWYVVKLYLLNLKGNIQSSINKEAENCIRINQTIQNPEFFEVDSIFLFDKNPHPINALDSSPFHPLTQKYSRFPFPGF